jgi:hypothetical protein
MPLRTRQTAWLRIVLGVATLGAAGCSSGGYQSQSQGPTDDGGAPPPPPPGVDAAAPAPDLSIVPVHACTWAERFQQVYGHAFSGGDVAFVTGDGAVTRGTDKLDLVAQKNQVPDYVRVKGNTSSIKTIQLLDPGNGQVLATRTGPYVYGLGYAMWLEANDSGQAGLKETTLLRQFGLEEPTYQQMVGLFRVLTKTAEAHVPSADVDDFRTAAAEMMTAIEAGQLTFIMGTGHGADFPQTAQSANGKRFSFQLSDSYGLDPQLGYQRDGVWGPQWQSYSPSGNWSASAPGMQPKCGGCSVDKWAGVTYEYCDGPADQPTAEATCRLHGGHLATVSDLTTNSFLRGLAPGAGSAFIGLSDAANQGQYVWASGQPATYVDWAAGQPDHYMGQEHCVQLVDGKSVTQWNDISCATKLPYICQLP